MKLVKTLIIMAATRLGSCCWGSWILAAAPRIAGVSGFSTNRGMPSSTTTATTSRFFSTNPAAASDTAENEKETNNRNQLHRTVRWITADAGTVEFAAVDGETLRSAALRAGVVSPHNGRANLINCRGLGTCGTCAVRISSSSTNNNNDADADAPESAEIIEPALRNTVERVRLSVPPGHGPHSFESSDLRLACQVRVRGDLTVTKYKGFWGQRIGETADRSWPTQPLGALEFVLDKNNNNSNNESSENK